MRTIVLLSAALGALSLAGGANAATIYSTTFQGATFTVDKISNTEFTFDIANSDHLTGDWAGAKYLGDFAFTNIGSPGSLTALLINPNTGQSTNDQPGGISNGQGGGCNGKGVGFYCFDLSPNIAVAHDLKFDISVTSGVISFASTGPDLKIDWTNSSSSDAKVGSLYSAAIPLSSNPGVPEPASWALMILGFGGVGAMLRARRQALGAATA